MPVAGLLTSDFPEEPQIEHAIFLNAWAKFALFEIVFELLHHRSVHANYSNLTSPGNSRFFHKILHPV